MKILPKLIFFLLASFCLAGGFSIAATPDKPNILLIVADDLGWNDVGWHGSKFQTPALDKLVREGVELDRHYVQPVCSPTRTALLSGKWTGRFGPHASSPTNLRVFPLGTTTLASALKDRGYTTHIAGKWHLGSKFEWGPNHYGFDHSYGSLTGAIDPWTHKYRKGPYEDTWHRDLLPLNEEGNATELIAHEVLGWIKNKQQPWLVYVPFHAVHIPIDAPDQYKKLFANTTFDADPKKNESLQRMAAFVAQMDDKVGTFVQALDETGQRQNTLIVFTSDNGGLKSGANPYVGNVPDSPAISSNEPLRGYKNQLYEGGVRVPAFVNWPGQLAPRKVTAPMHAADWVPTLTKLAGWQAPANLQFDGLDIWPQLNGAPLSRTIYIPHPTGSIVLRDGWKLIARKNGTNELFNVTDDPSEKQERAKDEPAHVQQLLDVLSELRKNDLTKLPDDLKGSPE